MINIRHLLRRRDGATAIEFALIAGLFLPLCLAILDAGLLLWTEGTLQSTASLTARCAALTSPVCTDPQQFAVSTEANWVFASILTTANVTSAAVCIAGASFMKVTITCPYWAGAVLPPPLNGLTLTAVAYFPVAGAPCT